METPCNLSVVIPAYNEAHTIYATLMTVARYLAGLPLSWEILIVNDGSQDETAAQVREAAQAWMAPERIRLLEHARNLGKGAAVRTGVLATHGQFILFYDADGATPIEELAKFLPKLQDGADVVVGSRRIPGAQVRKPQPWLRQSLGRIYTGLTNLAVSARVSDITCGFKMLNRSAAQAIFSRMAITGWSFDAELFFLAHRMGYRVVEVPVVWFDQPNTKVRMLRHGITSFCELVRIRWRALTGGYRASGGAG